MSSHRLIWMLSQGPFLFPIKPFFYAQAVLSITIMHCILFGRGYCVLDAWSTLDCKCVFFGAVLNWIEDKRHTPLVAALSFRRSLWGWRNDSQRRHSLPFSFSLYVFFFTLYLSQSFSLILSPFSFLTISVPVLSPHPACLRHLAISLVFLSLSLLLEDTRCKQSSSQRHTLHTISLAFKGVEYSQLCWKLNSLKPPFPLQQFIVGEFSVFGEQLGLSRGWCQRAPIVPCSTAVSPPPRLPSTFPSSPDTHFVTEKGEPGMCVSHIFLDFWMVYSAVQEVQIILVRAPKHKPCSETRPRAQQARTTRISRHPHHPSTWLHMPPLDDRTSCTGGK